MSLFHTTHYINYSLPTLIRANDDINAFLLPLTIDLKISKFFFSIFFFLFLFKIPYVFKLFVLLKKNIGSKTFNSSYT